MVKITVCTGILNIKFLISHGASSIEKNNDGLTPLDLMENEECKKESIKYIEDIDSLDVKGVGDDY